MTAMASPIDHGPLGHEGALVAQLRERKPAAFAALMQQNNQKLWRIARGILRDESEAEEAVQEAYVSAFSHIDGFRGEASLSTWLARIVVNEALKIRSRRQETVDLDDVVDALPIDHPGSITRSTGLGPEHAAAHREIRRLIEDAVNALPSPFRLVFMMRVVERMSIEETAAGLGIPQATVKTRLHRANRQIREALGAEFATIFDESFPFLGARCERMTRSVLARLGFPDQTGDAGEESS
jgi:RNA polymerase sigma-70 factor, ECF subfamily